MATINTMSNPKVSVIVCTYNQENTIGRTLESILSQEVDFDYEIVLADDCSSDSTPEICKDYAARYPDIIRLSLNNPNKGIVDNYFDCIELCRGEYIADLAGDDFWVDNKKLAKQAAILDSDSYIVLCHAGWKAVYPDESPAESSIWCIPNEEYIKGGAELTLSLLRHEKEKNFIHLCSAMYRRDTVTALMQKYPQLFRNKWLTCEDFQLNVMLSASGKIAYIPDTVLHYTIGAPSISSDENPLKVIRFNIGVVKLTLRLAEVLGVAKSSLADYFASVMQYIIMQYFVHGSREGKKLVNDLLREEEIPLSLKNRITLVLGSNNITWNIARKIRGYIKRRQILPLIFALILYDLTLGS